MKRVIIELPEEFSDLITITAVGANPKSVNVTTHAANLENGTHLSYDGKNWMQSEVKE